MYLSWGGCSSGFSATFLVKESSCGVLALARGGWVCSKPTGRLFDLCPLAGMDSLCLWLNWWWVSEKPGSYGLNPSKGLDLPLHYGVMQRVRVKPKSPLCVS